MTVSINGTTLTLNDGTTVTSGSLAPKLWVAYNPQSSSIYSSSGVSSVSGFTVNFSTAISDTNYAFATSFSSLYSGSSSPDPYMRPPYMSSKTTTAINFSAVQTTPTYFTVVVYR